MTLSDNLSHASLPVVSALQGRKNKQEKEKGLGIQSLLVYWLENQWREE